MRILPKWHYFLCCFTICFQCLTWQGVGQISDDSLSLDSMEVDDYEGDLFTKYPFLDETKNEIFLPTAKTLAPFFDKLYALESNQQEKVHIVHIGDSHIQADFFTGQIRSLFHEDIRFLKGSRGFTFPYRAAKTNNPMDYRVRYSGVWEPKRSTRSREFSEWGLSGINAVTYSSNSTITINPNKETVEYEINRVKIFYPVFDKTSFRAKIALDSGNIVTSEIIGDGYVEFTFLKAQEQVTILLDKTNEGQNQFIMQGVMLESDRAGITYSASGVNGAEVPTFFRCDDFNKQLAQIQPDLIVISLGTNDAYIPSFDEKLFVNNYKKLIEGIRKYMPNVPILLTTASDNYRRRRPNKNMEKAAEEINLLAKEMDLAVWDLFQVMGGFRSIKEWRANNLCGKDMLHFTQRGYAIQGELFFQALDMAYEEYCSKLGN